MPTSTKINVLTPIIAQLAGQLPQIAALAAASPSTTAPITATDPIVPLLNSLAGTSTALLTLAQNASLSTKAVSAVSTALPLIQAAVASATSGTSPPVQADAVNLASTAGSLLASIAAQIAATNITITMVGCRAPLPEDLNDFQTAYALVDPTFKVTGAYDAATAAAIAKTLNIPVSTCPTTTTPLPPPPLHPLPPGGSTTTTTTTTTTVAAPSNTALYVVSGVAALGIGALLLKMHQSNRLVRSTRR